MIESPATKRGVPITMTVPDYQRVIDHVVALIKSGELRPGDALPSIAQLAEALETSQTTVKTAQGLLRATGWIVGQQGKAVYVAPEPPTGE